MKKTRASRWFLSIVFLAPFFLASTFNACSNTGFEGFESSMVLDQNSLSSLEVPEGENNLPISLMSSEQVVRSMASVTGIPLTSAVLTEYDNRQSLLASGYDLKMLNPPMMIGITNVASTFCDEILKKEKTFAVNNENRIFFKTIDFNKPISNITEDQFQSSIFVMAFEFWGRSPIEEELNSFTTAKQEFIDAIPSVDISKTTPSTNLMLMMCTAMLSSFDSITID